MTTQFKLTKENVKKVLETVDAGLSHGLGKPVPGQMCVEAAVCYALGLPHGDDPGCVSPAVRSLKISLNDNAWSSNKARAAGMRRLAVIQLGTAGVINDREFARRVAEMSIRVVAPRALRAAASTFAQDSEHRTELKAAAELCEKVGAADAEAASYAAEAAGYAAEAAAEAAAVAATSYATKRAARYAVAATRRAAASAAYAARYAAEAARYAAEAASYAAEAASYAAEAAAVAATSYATRRAAEAAKDKELSTFAEYVVGILIDMKAPATALMRELTPKPRARKNT